MNLKLVIDGINQALAADPWAMTKGRMCIHWNQMRPTLLNPEQRTSFYCHPHKGQECTNDAPRVVQRTSRYALPNDSERCGLTWTGANDTTIAETGFLWSRDDALYYGLFTRDMSGPEFRRWALTNRPGNIAVYTPTSEDAFVFPFRQILIESEDGSYSHDIIPPTR